MAAHPLDGVVAKFERAHEHLETLNAEVRAFADEKPHRMTGYLDPDASRYSLRIAVEREPPLRWSILVGDIVHNLRSGLDHLLWQLILVSRKRPSRGNQFPIWTKKPTTQRERQQWQRQVKGLSADILAVLKNVQPYNAGDRAKEHCFALLNALSNEDKHQLPVASVTAIEAHTQGTLSVVATDIETKGYKLTYGRPLEGEQEVLWSNVKITGPNPHMELNGTLPLDVAFGDSLVSGQGLVEILNHCEKVARLFGAQFFA